MQPQARLWVWTVILAALVVPGLSQSANPEDGQFGTPRDAEGTRIFSATEHSFYSGQFHLGGEKATLVGSMHDVAPWDHLDYAGKRLKSVQGTIEIDVNELTNTGQARQSSSKAPTAIGLCSTGLQPQSPSRTAESPRGSTNTGIQVTAILCILKLGSIWPDGALPLCSRTVDSSTKTIRPTSW